MVTVEADVVRVEFRLAVGGIGCPTCRDGVLGGWGVCPGPADRGAQRSAAAVAGALPAVQGHPCVVAGDGAIAQSVCGGTHLGCAGRTMLLEGRLPESWIPPAHVVEMRTLGRLYCALMDERRAWQQRIHAQLFYQGWPPFGRRCRRQGATRSRVPSCRRWVVSMWIPRCGALVSSAPRSIRCEHNWPVSPSTRRGVGRCDSCIRNPIGPPIPCRPCRSCGLLIHYG
jgi:hypothetical protein